MLVIDTDIQKAKSQPKKLPTVITSFNKEGYKRYGADFIRTWLEFWPRSIKLIVYYEGEESDFDMVPGVSWHPIETVEFLMDYMANLRFPIMHGIVGDKFDMWFDAGQGRKVCMQMHTMKTIGGKVFWIDADVVTTRPVPEGFLDQMLPDDKFNCYLGRDGWYHTETGFIGFNGDHPLARKFSKNYLHTFLTGTIFAQQFFGRPGWNDCCGFDVTRYLMSCPDEFVNLAKHVPQGHMHPWQISATGKYMNHYKGNRKDTKKLLPEDTAGCTS